MARASQSKGQSLLRKYTDEMTRIFVRWPEKRAAQERGQQLLLDMAGDPAALTATLEHEIRKPGALNTRHFPTIGLTILGNAHYGLVANCFLPIESGETDLTANSIHHHGHMLLSTVTAFGPGYEHWRFTRPAVVDASRDLFSMNLIDRAPHRLHDVAFVDTYMPHAVMVPPSLTITFALWTSEHQVTWRDHAKRLPILRGRENTLRALAGKFGLGKRLKLNVIRYFDYFPTREGFKGMRERIQFKRGPNEDFLHSFFHVLQRTGNEALGKTVEAQMAVEPIDSRSTLIALLGDLRAGRPITSRMSEGLHRLDHMNFKAHAIEQTLTASRATRESRESAALGAQS